MGLCNIEVLVTFFILYPLFAHDAILTCLIDNFGFPGCTDARRLCICYFFNGSHLYSTMDNSSGISRLSASRTCFRTSKPSTLMGDPI